MPSITCNNVTACSAPGQVIPLAGSCSASNPNASLVYLVNGVPSTSMTCPPVNTTVTVTVQPQFPLLPTCPYNATTGFNATSEQGRPAKCMACTRGAVTASMSCHVLPVHSPRSLSVCPRP
jgi:hypothetical protein